ncbi:MAG: hypothetical protein ACI9SK_001636 [Zhongshania sp.]|jgi:hypothetical protein
MSNRVRRPLLPLNVDFHLIVTRQYHLKSSRELSFTNHEVGHSILQILFGFVIVVVCLLPPIYRPPYYLSPVTTAPFIIRDPLILNHRATVADEKVPISRGVAGQVGAYR